MPTLKRWYVVEVNGVIHAVNPPDDRVTADRLRESLGSMATIVPIYPADSVPEQPYHVPHDFGQSGFGGEPAIIDGETA